MFASLSYTILFFSGLVFWVIYIIVEALRRYGYVQGEAGRKAIHIGIGIFIASMPVFATRTEIIVVNGLFFLGLLALSGLKLIKAYEDVDRWTIGQFLYPLSIIMSAFLFEDALVFSFAVLELALADGFAALIGKKFGENSVYHIPGGIKTFVGSATFFVVTLALILTYASIESDFTPLLGVTIVGGAFTLTVVEGIIAAGFDNLALPVLMGVILQLL
jgi:dolichol kinase